MVTKTVKKWPYSIEGDLEFGEDLALKILLGADLVKGCAGEGLAHVERPHSVVWGVDCGCLHFKSKLLFIDLIKPT